MKRAALLGLALLLAGCSDAAKTSPVPSDAGADVTATASWHTVLKDLDGALLGVWGASGKDVWAVGGSLGNGLESLVVRFDGTTWKRVKPGGTDSFWWVHGASATDVWLVGENGRATHWDGAAFTDTTTGSADTLYGVIAFAKDDVWAVGGLPEKENVVLHWNGSAWAAETLPEQDKLAFFKVWGTSADDLWVVGEQGTIWHRAAGAWTKTAPLSIDRLTTVNGCSASEIYAVGGRTLLAYDGKAWTKSSQPLVNDVNGVSCRDGKAVIVGGGSLKLRLVSGQWQDDFGTEPFTDLHATWIDDTGAFWAVGGNFNASAKAGATRGGVVARYAADVVSGVLVP